jgi:nucleotide-binding universal stress UspA family protein/predicted phosphoribosyltransferase
MHEILAAIDFSGPSQRACDFAVELAKAHDAELVLLHVVEPLPAYLVDAASEEAVLGAEARALADRAEVLRPHVRSLQTLLVAGHPYEQIVRVADERKVDLVTVGTHGRRGLARAVLGSVAERVVRTCPRPVVTVPGWAFASRESAAERLGDALAPLGLEAPMVIALSRAAVPIATTIASRLGGSSEVWLVGPVAMGGRVVGAVTEEGDAVFDTEPSDRATADARKVAVEATRRVLQEQLMALRGGRSIGDVWHRDVVIVDDGLVSPSTVLAAARSLRAFLPHKLVAAFPLAERAALTALEGRVDRVMYLEPTVGCDDRACWYRDDSIPSPASARARIDGDRESAVGSRRDR